MQYLDEKKIYIYYWSQDLCGRSAGGTAELSAGSADENGAPTYGSRYAEAGLPARV
jgi:hypothetical protein